MAPFYAEPRLPPLGQSFVDCKCLIFAPRDNAEARAIQSTWALKKHVPSMLRRRHSIGGYVPHALANLEPPSGSSRCSRRCAGQQAARCLAEEQDDAAVVVAGFSVACATDDLAAVPVVALAEAGAAAVREPAPAPAPAPCADGWPCTDDEFEVAAPGRGGRDGPAPADDIGRAPAAPRLPGAAARCPAAAPVTTVMIRNIPPSASQADLRHELDAAGFGGLYDFLYMPSSFEKRASKGYAFVNFVSASAASALMGAWHGSQRFPNGELTLNISPAVVQGLDANMRKWARMSRVRDPSFRPCVLRSGAACPAATSPAATSGPRGRSLEVGPSALLPPGSPVAFARGAPVQFCVPAAEPPAAHTLPGPSLAYFGHAGASHLHPNGSATMPAALAHDRRRPTSDLGFCLEAAAPPALFQGSAGGSPLSLSAITSISLGASEGPGAAGSPVPWTPAGASLPLSPAASRPVHFFPGAAPPSPLSFWVTSQEHRHQDVSPDRSPCGAGSCELGEGITTVMVRNLRRDLQQHALLEALDAAGFTELYDFVYMPCSFEARESKGYAFVNFTQPDAAAAFATAFQKTRRAGITDAVGPALNVSAAAVQGLEANLQKWAGPRMNRIRNPALRPFVRGDGRSRSPVKAMDGSSLPPMAATGSGSIWRARAQQAAPDAPGSPQRQRPCEDAYEPTAWLAM